MRVKSQLLGLAGHIAVAECRFLQLTASHLETVVRAVRRRTANPATAEARRSLSWYWAGDGSLVLRGRLAPAEGAALVAAIEALVPPRPDRPATRRAAR